MKTDPLKRPNRQALYNILATQQSFESQIFSDEDFEKIMHVFDVIDDGKDTASAIARRLTALANAIGRSAADKEQSALTLGLMGHFFDEGMARFEAHILKNLQNPMFMKAISVNDVMQTNED